MRDDAIRQRLRQRNPWWRAGGGDHLAWTTADETLREATRYDIGYAPSVVDDLAPGDLIVLRGPRRVGKSVVLKRFIAALLGRGISPWQVIYLALNDFSAQDLRRALVIGRVMTSSVGDEPRYWVFDEITSVSGWTKVIKDARDETPLRRDAVLVTGSSAHDLEASRRDLGAGRVGAGERPFRLLLPMTFREVVATSLPEVALPAAVTPDRLQDPDVARAAQQLDPFIDELDLAWQAYLEHGGFPRAVAEASRTGAVSRAFCRDLRDWLAPDIAAGEPAESVLALISAIGARMSSPLDVLNTSEAVGLTRATLQTRINRLRATMAAIACPHITPEGQPVARGQSKVYLLDPLIAELPGLLDAGLPVPDATVRTEAAIATHIARAVERVQPDRLLEGRAVGYVRTGGGREIDFGPLAIRVGGQATSTVPVESKWVSTGWRTEARVIEGKYGRGVVATKSILDTSTPAWAIPAPVVALLLG